jgi:hypothetical protein
MLVTVEYGGGTVLVNEPTAKLIALREELGVLALEDYSPLVPIYEEDEETKFMTRLP